MILDASSLMKKYLDSSSLTHDECELLLFSLYVESLQSGGLARQAHIEMGIPLSLCGNEKMYTQAELDTAVSAAMTFMREEAAQAADFIERAATHFDMEKYALGANCAALSIRNLPVSGCEALKQFERLTKNEIIKLSCANLCLECAKGEAVLPREGNGPYTHALHDPNHGEDFQYPCGASKFICQLSEAGLNSYVE
jgi:hypothetical protein